MTISVFFVKCLEEFHGTVQKVGEFRHLQERSLQVLVKRRSHQEPQHGDSALSCSLATAARRTQRAVQHAHQLRDAAVLQQESTAFGTGHERHERACAGHYSGWRQAPIAARTTAGAAARQCRH